MKGWQYWALGLWVIACCLVAATKLQPLQQGFALSGAFVIAMLLIWVKLLR